MSEVADRDDAPRETAAGEPEPGFAELFAEQFAEQFSNGKVIGGPRELTESVLPMTMFSVVYGLHVSMQASVLAAVACSLVFTVWRLIGRQPLTHAFAGVFGIGIGALLALWTGRAENFVAPSLLKNSVMAVVLGVSGFTKYPILGFFIGLMRGEGFDWADRPERVSAYRRATWLWAAMSVLRLAVQVPLWQAGAAAALGLVNVVLGLPLFAAVMWLTLRIVREPGDTPHQAPA